MLLKLSLSFSQQTNMQKYQKNIMEYSMQLAYSLVHMFLLGSNAYVAGGFFFYAFLPRQRSET